MYRSQKRRRPLRVRRLVLDVSIGLIVLGIIANGVVWFIYRERTYPRTTVLGTAVGNISHDALPDKIAGMKILPSSLQLYKREVRINVSTHELGVVSDTSANSVTYSTSPSWLPIANLFIAHHVTPPVRINEATLQTKTNDLQKTFTAEPVNARLAINNNEVAVMQSTDGYELDTAALARTITDNLRNGNTKIEVPTSTKPATVQASQLKSTADNINRQLSTKLTIRYGTTITKPSGADMARWYNLDTPDSKAKASEGHIISYLTDLGLQSNIRIKDGQATATTIANALAASKDTDISLTAAATVKTFTYCTATKSVNADELPALQRKAKSTLADPRGWSANGSIAFKEVASNCDFTLWLAAPLQMPTFGAICDSMWSCRVGPNVVINFDRWQHASPAWNDFGGSLEAYRDMVINHEVGHWLGFGHDHCPGNGQIAPVMQQQSINLQGCTFNPWPVADEISRLRQKLNL